MARSETVHTISFVPNEAAARQAIVATLARVDQFGTSEAQHSDVEIAVTEVVNNVVEHACAGLPLAVAQISCWMDASRVFVKISDTGRAMPEEALPAGSPANVSGPLDALPEGGFGWFLIRRLTSNVRYDRRDARNCVTLEFQVEATS